MENLDSKFLSKVASTVSLETKTLLDNSKENKSKNTIMFSLLSDITKDLNILKSVDGGKNISLEQKRTFPVQKFIVYLILLLVGFGVIAWLYSFFARVDNGVLPDLSEMSSEINWTLIFYALILLVLGLSYRLLLNYFKVRENNKSKEYLKKSFTKRQKSTSNNVYDIISNVYETISEFRAEKLRQAKNSFNISVFLLTTGTLIICFGMYMLINNQTSANVLTSVSGIFIDIFGGVLFNLYKHTNKRLDKLENDLQVLYSAKVKYSLILNIEDINQKNNELSKLISTI